MEIKLMNDIEMAAKRQLYLGQRKILDGYQTNVKQEINKVEEGNKF
ncbi:MAG: hypothetical protein K0S80_5210 [Neobacillus sp.]|jgi:hypothetical protein|nr:hypothetical protein [Neobacillus sp.]